MIQHVSFERTTFNELPFKFEGRHARLHRDPPAWPAPWTTCPPLGMDSIAAHEHDLTQYALQRLREIPGMRI